MPKADPIKFKYPVKRRSFILRLFTGYFPVSELNMLSFYQYPYVL